MAIYSINDLETLSGIKAHTIRIWEQRYGILEPKRTHTNVRYYQDDDLKLLLNVALLNKRGIKISKIAKMPKQEIVEKVADVAEISYADGTQPDALTISMMEMDQGKFDRIIRTNTTQIGFERTMLEVIYPFLEKLSLLWLTGSITPVQEKFISYLIRQKLINAINDTPLNTDKSAKRIFLYLPQGERQELSLLFMYYMLKKRGFCVLYLGQEVTIDDLEDAHSIRPADYIFTLITETFSREPLQHYINRLADAFPKAQVLLSGYQVVAQEVALPGNVVIMHSLDHLLGFFENQ